MNMVFLATIKGQKLTSVDLWKYSIKKNCSSKNTKQYIIMLSIFLLLFLIVYIVQVKCVGFFALSKPPWASVQNNPHSSVMMVFCSLSSFSHDSLKTNLNWLSSKIKKKNLFILITINEIQNQKQNVINQVFK